MRVSIFTPSHNPKYLRDLYESIREQDFYEWVILLNNTSQDLPVADDRVKVYRSNSEKGFVGELKKIAASYCTGDILLEVDHDDLLTPDAIEEVKAAFQDPEVGFVYSNHAEFTGNFQKAPRFAEVYGWQWRPFKYGAAELDEVIAFPPTPASVSRIWFAPNHLRAWRKSVYDAIGGHRADMRVLDDQELMSRTYVSTKFCHINKCLYLYRVDGENSWIKHNAEIQANTIRLYDETIFPLALRWCDLNGLRKLDFGGAYNGDARLENYDLTNGIDLNESLPCADNSVGLIRANDVLEHLDDKLHIIKEIYRVLAPGGILLCMVPSALSQGAFQDPTHKQFYVLNSFRYYTDKRFAQYIGTPVRFQEMRLYETAKNADDVSWVVAHLVCLKDQVRQPGIISI